MPFFSALTIVPVPDQQSAAFSVRSRRRKDAAADQRFQDVVGFDGNGIKTATNLRGTRERSDEQANQN